MTWCPSGFSDVRFLIIGQSAEESGLKANMRKAELAGVLNGTALARGYVSMDAFVFPSRTDTYGNGNLVMREAARDYAVRASWGEIFEGVNAVHERELRHRGELRKSVRARPHHPLPLRASPKS